MAAHSELPRLDIRCSQTPEVLVVNSSFMKKDMSMFLRAAKNTDTFFFIYQDTQYKSSLEI